MWFELCHVSQTRPYFKHFSQAHILTATLVVEFHNNLEDVSSGVQSTGLKVMRISVPTEGKEHEDGQNYTIM
jgi:hypothetical protein